MPLIRIDVTDQWSGDHLHQLADQLHAGVVAVLGVPDRDRFQIITTHPEHEMIALDAGLGFERTGRLVMVQITTQRGRTTAVKQQLYTELAARVRTLGVQGEDLFVGIVENGPEDWSFGHGTAQYLTGELAVPNVEHPSD